MGKTKKANYNKTKTEEIIGVVSDDAPYTIYSLDKGNRWDIKPVEAPLDPHEERRRKVAKEDENRTKKKEEFKMGLKCEVHNLQKKQPGETDYLGVSKRWYKNPRIDLPEKVKLQRQIQGGRREIEEDDEVSDEGEIPEQTKKINKKEESEDDEDFDSQEDSEEDVKVEIVKGVKKTKGLKVKVERNRGKKKYKDADF